MKLSSLIAALLFCVGLTAAHATECNDGSYSSSQGSGTCSHHGGEAK